MIMSHLCLSLTSKVPAIMSLKKNAIGNTMTYDEIEKLQSTGDLSIVTSSEMVSFNNLEASLAVLAVVVKVIIAFKTN